MFWNHKLFTAIKGSYSEYRNIVPFCFPNSFRVSEVNCNAKSVKAKYCNAVEQIGCIKLDQTTCSCFRILRDISEIKFKGAYQRLNLKEYFSFLLSLESKKDVKNFMSVIEGNGSKRWNSTDFTCFMCFQSLDQRGIMLVLLLCLWCLAMRLLSAKLGGGGQRWLVVLNDPPKVGSNLLYQFLQP